MGSKVAETAQVADRFLGCLVGRGYQETPGAPVTAGDDSVLFVGATITPFKPRLEAGEPLGRTCQRQRCLRMHGAVPWLLAFDMIGALCDGEHLPALCRDSVEALLAAAPWLSDVGFEVWVDVRDDDLRAAMDLAAASLPVRVVGVDGDDVDTRWRYGHDSPLRGRGLTIAVPDDGRRPSDGETSRELGNVIVIESGAGTYVEAAFGLESVAASRHGGDLYALGEIRGEVARLEGRGLPAADAAALVNTTRAVTRLLEDGARPGGKGAGHVLRRLALELVDWAAALDPGDLERAVRLACPAEVVDFLLAEARRRERSQRDRRAAAAAFARRNVSRADPETLRQTFGLSLEDAAQVVAAARQDSSSANSRSSSTPSGNGFTPP
jgi:hypothetical protein